MMSSHIINLFKDGINRLMDKIIGVLPEPRQVDLKITEEEKASKEYDALPEKLKIILSTPFRIRLHHVNDVKLQLGAVGVMNLIYLLRQNDYEIKEIENDNKTNSTN